MVGRIGTTQTTGAGGTRAGTMTTQTTAPVRCAMQSDFTSPKANPTTYVYHCEKEYENLLKCSQV